ncbi:MAG TPA: helix-turn-helix domain-containing protein [Anaerolineaceae bacterium]|nr:helix-turn-helix domain-containing protein [Anaerolineaceae bacterium]
MTPEIWMELAEAARFIGVHPSTLRRWADAGKIDHTRTLSGRRRFRRSDLEEVVEGMRRVHRPQEDSPRLETISLNLSRQRLGELSARSDPWLARMSEEQRLIFRYSGQRLLGLMMQFISRGESAETFLVEGKRVAGDYGSLCFKIGLSEAQTAEAFLYFRRSILESVQSTVGLGGPYDLDGHRIVLRTIDFFDALLVATIESYAQTCQSG